MKYFPILLAFAVTSISEAFFVLPQNKLAHPLCAVFSEEHAKQFVNKWTELEERGEDMKGKPNDDGEYELVKEMLELALDAVQTAEADEIDHVKAAHERLVKAEKLERELEQAAGDVHHEADDADGILDTYEKSKFKEDREMRRELAVSDIAHRVENYVESRLLEVREAEEAAKGEEDEAEKHLAQLLVNEREIRATLEELKSLRKKMVEEKNKLKP